MVTIKTFTGNEIKVDVNAPNSIRMTVTGEGATAILLFDPDAARELRQELQRALVHEESLREKEKK